MTWQKKKFKHKITLIQTDWLLQWDIENEWIFGQIIENRSSSYGIEF